MSSIKTFVQQEVLLPRLQKAGVLVVYDPQRRYRELCLELEGDGQRVIDASESSIESREAALATFRELGEPNPKLKGMLVYVPAQAPLTDEDRQHDPFAVYAGCGAVFPAGDGDEYLNLCLKAKADHATQIRRIFQDDPNPSFAVIDAVGGGVGWPTLQTLLGRESARDILFALLAPSQDQKQALKKSDAWVSEAKALFQSTLGLRLMTRGKTWSSIADELWRFVLFSEFVFDLPAELPEALADVPRAQPEAAPLVEDLCERLRGFDTTKDLYIEKAERIEQELNLPTLCASIDDLGVRDTFPFEERSFFAQAVDALQRDNLDKVRQMLDRHRQSVWTGKGENQVQWLLVQAATSLIETCEDAQRQLPEHARSQDALIAFYLASLREVDRLQREFEQAASDYFGPEDQMHEVIAQARKAYRRLAAKVQDLFVRHLERSGWPPAGHLANADVFDRLVAPKLQESGRRVAYLLIDALRYELGVALERQLADDEQVEMQAAFAQLPSVTPVGMASLLPGAGHDLQLVKKDGAMVPALGEQTLADVGQRMEVLRQRYGQRFAEVKLEEFIRGKGKIPETADLLVIRSNTIDSHMESTPEMALRIIQDALMHIRRAIHKLKGLGFQDVVIATDHGFYLNPGAEAGDVCPKPQGNWVNIHERCLLGDGTADTSNFVLPAEHLGIRGDFSQVACPRGLAAYRAGQWYFHGGASLQEALVPVISVRLQADQETKATKQPRVTLSYKRSASRVTTRTPVIEVAAEAGDLFSMGAPIEVLLEAQDKKGEVVGEARPGGPVNPATRTVALKPGETVQVPLRMNEEFEGTFSVKALDPATLTIYSKLSLETDYVV